MSQNTPPPDQAALAQETLSQSSGTQESWSGLPTLGDEDPLLGTVLNGAYVVKSVLGEGGMGRVYEAQHTRIPQKRFAIKVLHAEFMRYNEVLVRFQREAEAAASISHPNVIGVYDVDRTADGAPYLVCEYLEGVDLSAHIRNNGPLTAWSAVHIASQICDALQAAHTRGVIHRDVKPQNVFLMGDFSSGVPQRPAVKVLDFGLSRFQDSTDSGVTKTGVVMGTPSYMAPEQARGDKADHRTDIYGVGAILYASVTGQPPFEEDTPHMTVLAVMSNDPPRPRSIRPSVSEHLELVIQRAMAKNPEERYQDMEELKQALAPIEWSESPSRRPPPPEVIERRRATGTSFEDEAEEVRTARPRLVLYIVLAFLALTAGLASAVTALVTLMVGDWPFSRTEVALTLLAVAGTVLTPAVLMIRRLRSQVWGNSARVLGMVRALRAPVLAGLLAFGAAALVLRFVDEVVVGFAGSALLGQGAGVSWFGWSFLLPMVALLAVSAAVVRQRVLLPSNPSRLRRTMVGPVLVSGCVMLSAAALYAGLVWRTSGSGNLSRASLLSAPAAADSPSEDSAATPPSLASETNEGPPKEEKKPVNVKSATDEELAQAMAKGVEGLLPLSEKHPNDARILKALTLAFASRASGHADAMAIVTRLFALAPEEIHDEGLRYIISSAAETPGEASRLAFELMKERMGSAGPDLIYNLAFTSPKLSKQALELLKDDKVRANFSPALAVAYDLRFTDGCAEKLPLLERAAQLGDERAIQVLSPLSTGTKRGCGKWKNKPCKPRCADESKEFLSTIRTISRRLQATGQTRGN